MFEALVNAFRAPDIRRRILFVLGMLIIVRMLAHVPVPGVDRDALSEVIGSQASCSSSTSSPAAGSRTSRSSPWA